MAPISTRRPKSSLVGLAVDFEVGQFAGQTMRAELHELQKADLGRKYARKDRRPLDPPPVVQLKLFRVFHPDTERQSEEELDNYDEIQNFGLLCHIDLFQVPAVDENEDNNEASSSERSEGKKQSAKPSSYQLPVPTRSTSFDDVASEDAPGPYLYSASLPSSYNTLSFSLPSGVTFPPAHGPPMSNLREQDVDSDDADHPPPTFPSNSYSYAPSGSESDTVAYMGDYPIRESSKCTPEVTGSTFVQAAEVDHKGKKALMFVFSDLAVKREGTFILRYRFFDVFSRARGHAELPVLAERYGGAFRVYSTKEFPGLAASTALTKQVSLWGVRTNLRETERKRRKKSDTAGPSAASSASAMSAQNNSSKRKGKGKRKSQSVEESEGGDSYMNTPYASKFHRSGQDGVFHTGR